MLSGMQNDHSTADASVDVVDVFNGPCIIK